MNILGDSGKTLLACMVLLLASQVILTFNVLVLGKLLYFLFRFGVILPCIFCGLSISFIRYVYWLISQPGVSVRVSLPPPPPFFFF